MAKKTEHQPEPAYVPPPKVLTEAEEAANIARVRALTDEARANVVRLKVIQDEIVRLGGSISIRGNVTVQYVGIYGAAEPIAQFCVEASYSAKVP